MNLYNKLVFLKYLFLLLFRHCLKNDKAVMMIAWRKTGNSEELLKKLFVCCQMAAMPRMSNNTEIYPVGIYLLKVNNRNTRTRCEMCSKLTIKTPVRRSGVFIVNFEHISHLVLVFPLLTLSM